MIERQAQRCVKVVSYSVLAVEALVGGIWIVDVATIPRDEGSGVGTACLT